MFVNANFLTKQVTGLQRYALELSLAIQNHKNNLTFLSPRRAYPNTYYDNSKLNISKIGYSKNLLWEQIELPIFLKRKNNPFLINLTNTAPINYSNQVTVIHDLAFIHNPDWYSRSAVLLFKWLVRRAANSSRHIITVSNFSKNEIQKYFFIPSDKITVIPEGISTSILKLSNDYYPNSWGKYILTVATIEPRKNLINLIKAFLKAALPDFKLLIVGYSNKLVFNSPALDDFRKNKSIVFLGYVQDSILAGLYKNAKLFTYISYYEGFGIPPLEALVCGCPVLVSNSSSLPEVLGEFANYCDPSDTDDISKKISGIVSSNITISKKQIEAISNKYSWEKSSLLFLETINKLQASNN